MGAKLKVYGWRYHRRECPRAPNGGRQTREVMASASKATVREMLRRSVPLSEIVETGNAGEIATATAEPGIIFWKPIDDHSGRWARAGEGWQEPEERPKAAPPSPPAAKSTVLEDPDTMALRIQGGKNGWSGHHTRVLIAKAIRERDAQHRKVRDVATKEPTRKARR